jgi:hypothetical protein
MRNKRRRQKLRVQPIGHRSGRHHHHLAFLRRLSRCNVSGRGRQGRLRRPQIETDTRSAFHPVE